MNETSYNNQIYAYFGTYEHQYLTILNCECKYVQFIKSQFLKRAAFLVILLNHYPTTSSHYASRIHNFLKCGRNP